jgi:succinate dehydrogenase / fumarate reductase cytochrome b subunit
VSTISAPPLADARAAHRARHHRAFLLRRLHSLTGIVFGGYLVIHLIINATLAQSPAMFQAQVNKIHSLPFVLALEWAFIYLPIIFHTIYGIVLTFRAHVNVKHYPYGKNIYYTLQRISAFVIMFFLLFHVLGMKGLLGSGLEFRYENNEAARSTIAHINSNWFIAWFVYPVGVLASTYHLANGFWTAAITWGLTVSAGAQRRWGWVCGAIFVLTFACGMAAWIAALAQKGLVG